MVYGGLEQDILVILPPFGFGAELIVQNMEKLLEFDRYILL